MRDYKCMSLLDWVEKYPDSEPIIRKYDEKVGCCLLCHCLFDTIEEIEKTYQTNLQELVDTLVHSFVTD